MTPFRKMIQTLISTSFVNVIYSVLLLPTYLFLLKQQISIIGWETLVFGFVSMGFLGRIFQRSGIGYVYSIGFITASMMFMRVSAGNTIPTWIVLGVIGVVGFFSNEILSDERIRRVEFPRQIVLSGVILSFFLWYTFLFGAIFVTTIHPGILFLGCFVYTGAMAWVILNLYAIPQTPLIAILIAWTISILYRIIRFIPYTHITQAGILTVIVFYSLYLFREMYYLEGSVVKPLLVRLSIVLGCIVLILGTVS